MIGIWCFGVAIFTVLIMAGTYLFRLTEYLVGGIPLMLVAKFSILLMPGIVAKTFPMAVLLSTLLAFGRLSGDSEITALKACGASLIRILRPVALFGIAIGILAFIFNEAIVPRASLMATGLQEEIKEALSESSVRPEAYPLYENGKLVALISARDFDIVDRSLYGASIITYQADGKPSYILLANQLTFNNEKDWKIKGGSTLLSADGSMMIKLKDHVWPSEIPKVTCTPNDLISRRLMDLDALSISEIKFQIDQAKKDPYFDSAQKINLEFGFWNKIALPFTALVFGLVGAPLGIRNQRVSAASGFWVAILVTFGYMLMVNAMAIYAKGSLIPAYVASFTPLGVGIVAAGMIIYWKNR